MRKWGSSLLTSPHGRRRILSAISALPAFCALLFLAGVASSQAPTDEQRDAIRAECRSDFIAKCSGVTPGGIEALTCLQQHSATLSAGCQKAVSAVNVKPKSTSAEPTPAPATGAPPHRPTEAQRNALKSACQRDFMAQCSGVTPGGAAALSCLQQHNAALSMPCQQAVAALGGSAAPTTNDAAATGAITPAPRAMMPAFSPREEVMILRETCGADFRALCRMVPLGGGRGIACLRDNLERVSPECHRVLTSGL
ncbi:cysteine rich repeat-containing protein [Rhizobium sp. YTUHZ044]|uniref:cysteine rich repeat-containing protein n=1 Tax=Rhizobium sp. YTUHZ044 TaxID=2962678 RepID=UPI003DA7AAA4